MRRTLDELKQFAADLETDFPALLQGADKHTRDGDEYLAVLGCHAYNHFRAFRLLLAQDFEAEAGILVRCIAELVIKFRAQANNSNAWRVFLRATEERRLKTIKRQAILGRLDASDYADAAVAVAERLEKIQFGLPDVKYSEPKIRDLAEGPELEGFYDSIYGLYSGYVHAEHWVLDRYFQSESQSVRSFFLTAGQINPVDVLLTGCYVFVQFATFYAEYFTTAQMEQWRTHFERFESFIRD